MFQQESYRFVAGGGGGGGGVDCGWQDFWRRDGRGFVNVNTTQIYIYKTQFPKKRHIRQDSMN